MENELTKTLLLTLALPDMYVEDLTQEYADEYYGSNVMEQVFEALGLITSTARLLLLRGDMGGNEVMTQHAVLIDASIVERTVTHNQPEDERFAEELEYYEL